MMYNCTTIICCLYVFAGVYKNTFNCHFVFLYYLGHRPLTDVYKDIIEMQVDINKYRQWTNLKDKSLQSSEKAKAHILLLTQLNVMYMYVSLSGMC